MGQPDDVRSFSSADVGRRLDACVGRTLGEVDRTGVFSGRGRNKGVAGAVVEQSVLGYPADSRQEPDVRIDGVPYEVKTTGLVDDREAPGRYVAKEPMSVTAVSPDRIWREEFDDSAFWHKLEHMVLVYYLYNHGSASKVADTREYASFELLGYDLHEWSDHDRRVLESDWRVVRDFVERVHREGLDPDVEYPKISHELNRRLMYTDTAPKWPNRPRWRLKRATVTQLARECFDRRAAGPGARGEAGRLERLPSDPVSYEDVGRLCREVRRRYAGRTVAQVAAAVGYEGALGGKSVSEALLVRMLGGTARRFSAVEVFAKANVRCRTVVLTGSGRRTEDMKLARVLLDEVADPDRDWEDSAAREDLGARVLCAVFREPDAGAPLADNVFLGFRWLGGEEEVAEAGRAVWDEMRRLVATGELRDVVEVDRQGRPRVNARTGVPRSAPNWPKARDSIVFLRGSGRDSGDKPEVVNGVRMYRQSFWLRGGWVAGRLSEGDWL